jgi:hypothetical protein
MHASIHSPVLLQDDTMKRGALLEGVNVTTGRETTKKKWEEPK